MEDWQDHASCRGRDNNPFFPEKRNDARIERIKKLCRGCPVKSACLEFALEERMPDGSVFLGIWGGTTEDERDIIRLMLAGRRYSDARDAASG